MIDHLSRVRESMEREVLDALLVTDPPDITWISGFRFNPWERSTVHVVPRDGHLRFLLPGFEEDAVTSAVPDETELFLYSDDSGDDEAVRACLAGLNGDARLAVRKDTVSLADYERIVALTESTGLADCGPLLAGLRAVKDEDEIEQIRAASEIADRAAAILIANSLRPGATEAELGGELSRIMRLEGADGSAFEPNVTAGWRSALPHGPDHSRQRGVRPGQDAVQAGELLILDFSVVCGGYCADISRTHVLGESEERQREVFDIVVRAQREAIDACVPGKTAADVDRAARAVIEEAGHEEHFPHKTGHGLGLELHEDPSVSIANEQPLEPGMVFAVEPAIYLEGYGGARVEDVVLVTESGPEVLTDMRAQERLELPLR
jgi:Xaa-Pro aminopeptidase